MSLYVVDLPTHGLALAHTRYQGSIFSVSNPVFTESLKLTRNDFAYLGTLSASLSTDVGSGWDFTLNSEFRFLSYVPQIVASGKSGASTTLSNDPTLLVHGLSFSGSLGIQLGYSF